MKSEICEKIRTYFSQMSIYKDPEKTNSIRSRGDSPCAFYRVY